MGKVAGEEEGPFDKCLIRRKTASWDFTSMMDKDRRRKERMGMRGTH